jgi:hypothetical protein
MPYFVFRVSSRRECSLVSSFEKYPEARDTCRRLRAEESPSEPGAIRMAFAATEVEARRLLSEKRNPSSPLEEWEA